MNSVVIEDNRYGEGANTLLVIGNGFDLNLGLRTSYRDFVRSPYWPFRGIRRIINHGLGCYLNRKSHDYWFNLEQSLKDYCMLKSKVCESRQKKIVFEYEEVVKQLSRFIREAETGRIKRDSDAAKILKACCDSLIPASIVTFNYTNLVDFAHKIGVDVGCNPIYVHGSIETDNIILGFDESANVSNEFSVMCKSLQPGYLASQLSDRLSSYDNIILFGLSINAIDYPHFQSFYSDLFKEGATRKNVWLIVYDRNDAIRAQTGLAGLMGRDIHALKEVSSFNVIEVSSPAGKQAIDELCERINPS